MNMMRLALMLLLPLSVACSGKGEADSGSDDAAGDDGDGDGGGGDDGGGGGNADEGEALYAVSCAGCHGADGGGASGPDLNAVVPGMSEGAIEGVILDGIGGMPAISVSEEEAADIAAYVVATWG